MLRWFFCLDHVSMSNKCCLLLVFYYLWSLVVGDNLKIESPPVWKKCFFPYWTWWLSIVPQRHIWQFSFCLCLVFKLYCGYIGFQNGRDQSDENIVNRTCHNCHMDVYIKLVLHCGNSSAHQRNGKNATKMIYTASARYWRWILGQMNMKMFPRIKKQRWW